MAKYSGGILSRARLRNDQGRGAGATVFSDDLDLKEIVTATETNLKRYYRSLAFILPRK